jgi:hypothetical protein
MRRHCLPIIPRERTKGRLSEAIRDAQAAGVAQAMSAKGYPQQNLCDQGLKNSCIDQHERGQGKASPVQTINAKNTFLLGYDVVVRCVCHTEPEPVNTVSHRIYPPVVQSEITIQKNMKQRYQPKLSDHTFSSTRSCHRVKIEMGHADIVTEN